MWNPKTKPIELIDAENRPLMGRGAGAEMGEGVRGTTPSYREISPGA